MSDEIRGIDMTASLALCRAISNRDMVRRMFDQWADLWRDTTWVDEAVAKFNPKFWDNDLTLERLDQLGRLWGAVGTLNMLKTYHDQRRVAQDGIREIENLKKELEKMQGASKT